MIGKHWSEHSENQDDNDQFDAMRDEINALKTELAALKAQPVQEPVAWLEWDANTDEGDPDSILAGCNKPEITADGWYWKPLYLAAPVQPAPLTDEQIERLREKTFSTNNPFCPVDSKSMRKAIRAYEAVIKGGAT